jgi:hypothetical protein
MLVSQLMHIKAQGMPNARQTWYLSKQKKYLSDGLFSTRWLSCFLLRIN